MTGGDLCKGAWAADGRQAWQCVRVWPEDEERNLPRVELWHEAAPAPARYRVRWLYGGEEHGFLGRQDDAAARFSVGYLRQEQIARFFPYAVRQQPRRRRKRAA